MKNTVNAFERVTNISVQNYKRENSNGTHSDMVEVVKAVYPTDSVKVYSFKLANGSVSERRVNLVYKKTDSVKFESAYIRYWYALEKMAIEAEYKKFDFNSIPEEYAVRAEVVKARYDHAMKCLESFGNVEGVPVTVRLLVLCDRKAKEEVFPEALRADYSHVANALDALNELDGSDPAKLNDGLKSLRTAIDKYVCPHVWVKTEDGTVAQYIFHCNARLALDVYRVSEEGRLRDKEGKITTMYARTEKLLREVVYACFEELQKK